MKIGSLLKLARGGLGKEEIEEILGAMGLELTAHQLEIRPESFFPLADFALLPGSQMVQLHGKSKSGDSFLGLFVVNPKN